MPLEVLPYKASAAIQVQYQQNAVVDFSDDRTRYGRKKGDPYYVFDLTFANREPSEFHAFQAFWDAHFPGTAFEYTEPVIRTITTGSITSGQATLTVASTLTWAANQGIRVAGAGTAGADLVTTVSSIAGSVLTLAANASTTVSNAKVSRIIKLECYFISSVSYEIDAACAVTYRVRIEGTATS